MSVTQPCVRACVHAAHCGSLWVARTFCCGAPRPGGLVGVGAQQRRQVKLAVRRQQAACGRGQELAAALPPGVVVQPPRGCGK